MAEWNGPVPFDPAKHKPVQLEDGRRMTERLVTTPSPDNQWWAVPSVWFNQDGEHIVLDEETAAAIAKRYEEDTGKRFPRFKGEPEATGFAKDRSSKGGATKRSLMSK